MIQDMLSQDVLDCSQNSLKYLKLSFLKHFASRYSLKIVQKQDCFI